MAPERTREDLLEEIRLLRAELSAVTEGIRDAEDESPGLRMLGFQRTVHRFRDLLAAVGAVMAEVDADGIVRGASMSLARVLGYEREQLLDHPLSEIVHPDDRAECRELLAAAAARDMSSTGPIRLRHQDGRWRYFEVDIASRAPDSGTQSSLLFARDVTGMRNVLDALRESEDRYRALAENATDLIVELDAAGRILYVSPASRDVIGYDPEVLIGRSANSLRSDPNVRLEERDVVESLTDPSPAHGREFRVRHRDGSWRWFESRARSFRNRDDEERLVVISRDITLRKKAQRELGELEKRLGILIRANRDVVTETNPDRRLIYVSDSVKGLLGFAPGELVGMRSEELIHPEDRERVKSDYRRDTTNARLTFTAPYRCRTRDGGYRWCEGSALSYVRDDNQGRYVIGMLRDAQERIRLEQEQRSLEERAQRSQRLEGLGVMAGGIAHDFNNLLTPILGQTSLALRDIPRESPAYARLEKVHLAARRAAGLTQQMLAYAGKGQLSFERVDLSRQVRELAELLESAVSGHARIHFELDEALPPVEADPVQLSQVVMNLITNAVEAVDSGEGHITLRTCMCTGREVEATEVVVGEIDADALYVAFDVEDSGRGMDDATRGRIFDPFFTTKFTGRGLGLAAVIGIVRGHGGAIALRSARGVGTRFRVLLPPRPAGEDQPAATRPRPKAWTTQGLVLVADDDEGVRELASDTLERCGLRVVCAADGREAIEVFRANASRLRAVLLDRTMPIVSGDEALSAMQAIRTDVPVILVSGYGAEETTLSLAGRRIAAFIEKPFMPEDLTAVLRDVLGTAT